MRLSQSLALAVFTAVLALGPVLAATAAPAQQEGIFSSVNGKVQIKGKNGNKTRQAQKDSTVLEGERIVTDKDSKATLRLFDGSELNISPNTDFRLTKLQQPSTQDKIIQFKLFVGKLFAKVKKLASSKSSFEIEAGGVVCGVRGTQFSMDYNPDQNKVDLQVFEGSVYANSGGNSNVFNAGQNMEFINGVQNGNPGSNGQNPPGSKDENGALDDLENQFGDGLAANEDNDFTDPGVEGSVHLSVHVHVAPGEAVP